MAGPGGLSETQLNTQTYSKKQEAKGKEVANECKG